MLVYQSQVDHLLLVVELLGLLLAGLDLLEGRAQAQLLALGLDPLVLEGQGLLVALDLFRGQLGAGLLPRLLLLLGPGLLLLALLLLLLLGDLLLVLAGGGVAALDEPPELLELELLLVLLGELLGLVLGLGLGDWLLQVLGPVPGLGGLPVLLGLVLVLGLVLGLVAVVTEVHLEGVVVGLDAALLLLEHEGLEVLAPLVVVVLFWTRPRPRLVQDLLHRRRVRRLLAHRLGLLPRVLLLVRVRVHHVRPFRLLVHLQQIVD
jgi:hypothetical protein